MWREPSEISQDLVSDQPERINAAIRDLRESSRYLDEFTVPRLDLDRILPLLQPSLSMMEARELCGLLDAYASFVPPLSDAERMDALVHVVMFTLSPYAAFEANLFAKSHPDQLPTLVEAVRARLGREGAQDIAGELFSYLLNAEPGFRARVVAALRGPEWHEVRDFVRLELEPEELASLEG